MFRQVAAERLSKLNLLWIDVESAAADAGAFLREAHTLKGEAGLTGFSLVSKTVHALEDYVKSIRNRGSPAVQADGDLILNGLDLLSHLIRQEPETPSTDAEAFLVKVAGLRGKATADEIPAPTVVFEPTAVRPPRRPDPAVATPSPEDSGKATPTPVVVKRGTSIRITAEKIDHLRGMVSDLLLARVRWRQLSRSARHLRESVQVMREHGTGDAGYNADGWGDILGRLSAIESRLRDETHDLERFTGDLEAATHELRMIPLGTLIEHFPLPLRQLARTLGRQIRFQTAGEQVEVDKALLEMLEEPLLHLLRNAIDHGIEPPDERARAGKPPEACIRVVAGLVGQRLRLEVSDDGRGIDVNAIRARAIATGLLTPEFAQSATERDILRTIFTAGFSTREQVSEVSGRGIGLNIVLDVIENVGGKIDVRTEPARGTTFDIEVPLTVAITRVVLFHVGLGVYALPAASVRSVVESGTLKPVEGTDGPALEFGGLAVPLLDLGTVLGEPATTGSDTRILIAQSGADLVALSATRGHLEREVMLKPMGRFFERLPLVAAAVNLEEGALALVLKAAELVLLARSHNKRNLPASGGTRDGQGRIALVADDSPIVRDIIAQALRSYGLHVLAACDGEEALAMLDAHAGVDIVVTDIDMPRLDGIGFVRTLRSRAACKDLPVVAISMRGSEDERQAALAAGMSAFIDKSDFSQAMLWQTIRPFVERA